MRVREGHGREEVGRGRVVLLWRAERSGFVNACDRLDDPRHREHVHGDGRRTLRAHCEIDDEPNVLRDVTLTKNQNWDTLDAFDEQWLDYSEGRAAAEIEQLPETDVTAVSIHDPLPGTPPEGIHVRANVRVLPDEGVVEVDLRDNLDNLPSGLNLNRPQAPPVNSAAPEIRFSRRRGNVVNAAYRLPTTRCRRK